MRTSAKFSLALAALSISASGHAREVDLIDFSMRLTVSPPGTRPGGGISHEPALDTNPFLGKGLSSVDVGDSMRAEFLQRGVVLQPMPQKYVRASSAAERPLGRTSRSGRAAGSFAMPEQSAFFPFAMLPGSLDACPREDYQPTWWLGAEVERRRAAYYPMVAAVACEIGVPLMLLDAMIAQESGYKFWALSSKGAMGIMQLMPGTARAVGLAAVFDPLANMRAGARHLKDQLNRFGRVDLALAAYNAGPARRSLAAGMIPAIPETMNYVRTITTNWARLAQMRADAPVGSAAIMVDRGAIAAAAIRASGYREVELNRYDGMNAENPI